MILGAGDDAAVVDFIEQKTRISTVQTLDRWGFCWDVFNGRRSRFFNDTQKLTASSPLKLMGFQVRNLQTTPGRAPIFRGEQKMEKPCVFFENVDEIFLGGNAWKKMLLFVQSFLQKVGSNSLKGSVRHVFVDSIYSKGTH